MRRTLSLGWAFWRTSRRLFLIALSGALGAILGQYVGAPFAIVLGKAGWAVHWRCAGWTIFTLTAAVMAIGAPTFLLRFWHESEKAQYAFPRNPRQGNESYGYEDSEVVGIRAVPVMCGVGAMVGLICGMMLAGTMIVLYFFVVLSPFAPDGWWPVLHQLAPVQWTGDGFVGEGNSSFATACVIVCGAVIVMSAVLGPFWNYMDVKGKRYRVFQRKARQ